MSIKKQNAQINCTYVLCLADGAIKGYAFEPVKTFQNQHEDLSPSGEQEALKQCSEPQRLLSSDWCTCALCTVMPTVNESICCSELPEVVKRKVDHKCITAAKGFHDVCLNKEVLDMSISLRQSFLSRPPGQQRRSNELYRHIAYSNFIHWIYNRSLGRHKRVPLPACAVLAIREAYADPNNVYVGFENHNNWNFLMYTLHM